jgi:hypothetical protein
LLRRSFLSRSACGIGAAALASLLRRDAAAADKSAAEKLLKMGDRVSPDGLDRGIGRLDQRLPGAFESARDDHAQRKWDRLQPGKT